ncbi:Uncharacterized membrane protein, DUF485 family [Streptomyces sp. 2224.1]|uniref:DUF485 domain-containing protein n=1 Tax=unclassified Streptomyces TaxID=2593676 RepID=UPI00089A2EE6|nr:MULTISPECIES: DUF485 domain-containing protein [unclassified Streptomyces]SEE11878.1 Uncharacterized membrane protein, DUF485 family [Streptomyces sp. 2112.3]SEE34182.1 Uncharacterized membrane protein, DUF485 family [Streptomyces sp. 2224.1]
MDKQDGRSAGESGGVRLDDPWYDALASGWGELDDAAEAAAEWGGGQSPQPVSVPEDERSSPHDEIYLAVQRSVAFQEVRRRYRRFVLPGTAVFLAWYLAYVIAATAAPGLMAHRVAGALNVAMLAGLGQFATTFLLTWAYARHARLRRDSAALDIRWETQELTGGNVR